MKKFLFALSVALIFGIGFTSCLNDDQETTPVQYLEMGVVKIGGSEEIRVFTDSGLLLEFVSYPTEFEFEEDSRVMVKYSVNEEGEEADEYDYLVDVYSIQEIRLKDIIELNDESRDTIGDDQIFIRDIWVSGAFLNIDFSFYGSGEVHYINVIKDPEEQTDDPSEIYLEVRHNARGDEMKESSRGIMSLRLEPLQIEGLDKVELIFKNQGFYAIPFSPSQLDYEYGTAAE
jgi:hypothetical protein